MNANAQRRIGEILLAACLVDRRLLAAALAGLGVLSGPRLATLLSNLGSGGADRPAGDDAAD